jgi:hypothetical protein
MAYGAIDLHKKESPIRIITETGQGIDRRIATTRDRLRRVFGAERGCGFWLKRRPRVNGSRCPSSNSGTT